MREVSTGSTCNPRLFGVVGRSSMFCQPLNPQRTLPGAHSVTSSELPTLIGVSPHEWHGGSGGPADAEAALRNGQRVPHLFRHHPAR